MSWQVVRGIINIVKKNQIKSFVVKKIFLNFDVIFQRVRIILICNDNALRCVFKTLKLNLGFKKEIF